MGVLSRLFKKPDPPEPYDWAFVKKQCVEAIEDRVAPSEVSESPLGNLDYDRLIAAGKAEDVVMELVLVLDEGKAPQLSPAQIQEYLNQAAEMLRSDVSAEEAASRLREIEDCVRKR